MGGAEFNNWVEGLPDPENVENLTAQVESEQQSKINDLGMGVIYKLSSNENQDFFSITLGNIKGQTAKEISFDGTAGDSLPAINNYILKKIANPNGMDYIKHEDLPGYSATDAAILQEDINQALKDISI